jgi:8-oxo-dGTP pyrophosphatase MutT (NUDIX family)
VQESASSETIYSGKVVSLRVETLPDAIGGTRRFEIVEHADAVAIVAVRPALGADAEPEVALVRQFRPAVQRTLWEIPAGLLNPAERDAPEQAAARELREETGYTASAWRLLTRQLPSPGFSTEAISIYLATGMQPASGTAGGQPEDPSEIERVQWVSLGEALRMCSAGEIDDGKTLLGLHLAREALAADAAALPTTAAGATAGAERDEGLRLENMLLEEFKYVAGTAGDAIADRARIFDRYLLLVGGVLVAGVGFISQANQFGGQQYIQPVAIAGFLVSGVLGVWFFATLIRLRHAYRESLVNMNVIKDYYIQAFKLAPPRLEKVFRWRMETLPKHERIGSVWYLTAHIVALVSSLCFGATALLALNLVVGGTTRNQTALPSDGLPYLAAVLVTVATLFLYSSFFTRSTSSGGDAVVAKKKADELGIATSKA